MDGGLWAVSGDSLVVSGEQWVLWVSSGLMLLSIDGDWWMGRGEC